MSQELKPCPFCGERPKSLFTNLVLRLAFWKAGWHIECRCGAEGPKCITRERAEAAWNRRPA
jgi:hypothetical protein